MWLTEATKPKRENTKPRTREQNRKKRQTSGRSVNEGESKAAPWWWIRRAIRLTEAPTEGTTHTFFTRTEHKLRFIWGNEQKTHHIGGGRTHDIMTTTEVRNLSGETAPVMLFSSYVLFLLILRRNGNNTRTRGPSIEAKPIRRHYELLEQHADDGRRTARNNENDTLAIRTAELKLEQATAGGTPQGGPQIRAVGVSEYGGGGAADNGRLLSGSPIQYVEQLDYSVYASHTHKGTIYRRVTQHRIHIPRCCRLESSSAIWKFDGLSSSSSRHNSKRTRGERGRRHTSHLFRTLWGERSRRRPSQVYISGEGAG